MSIHRQNKALIWSLWQSLQPSPRQAAAALRGAFTADIEYFGFFPLKRLSGAAQLLDVLWLPLLRAFPDLMRRPYILLAGEFIGTFVHDWLGIRASGRSVKFRYGEFCRIRAGKIDEIRLLVDLPDLIRQADRAILPPNFGSDGWTPGPLAGDGLLLDASDAAASEETLRLIEEMIFGGLNRYDQKNQDSQGLERFWSAEMLWHGPLGIGTTCGLDEFKRSAQGPIVAAFPDRKGIGHQARIADGIYAASTGWPSLVGTHQNDFMGWAATQQKVGWDIMDFWRRKGALLRENWVLIDLIDAARQSGVCLYPPLNDYFERSVSN